MPVVGTPPPVSDVGAVSGPCTPWTSPELVPCFEDFADPPLSDILDAAIDAASDLLYEASGRAYGLCETTIRPCAQYSQSDDASWARISYAQGNWTTWTYQSRIWSGFCSCNRGRECGCSRLSEVRLSRARRVREVTEVRVDGVALDPSSYRVDDGYWLVGLLDGDGNRVSWPCCQDMALDDTEPDTFAVDAILGAPIPPSGQLAAAALACELAKQSAGLPCRLPKNTVSQSRQGVSQQFGQFATLTSTGIWEVNAFLEVYGRKGGRSGIMIPGERPHARKVGA